ncbi:disulfide bond formation protein B [Streptomyces otsuchiensis]|uniref:disulfide bond formation protein B n=1 Tax=Streptomyces otsuchiensis TaxID=2681388 RepID=UPI0010314093|nr:disulfide bond formation protein B [Streptomyces otsuchiensis]
MAVLVPDRLAQTGERPSGLERGQYWFACLFVTGWSGVLAVGLHHQFTTGEQPCPLAMLQRTFMVLAVLGAAYIVRRGLSGGLSSRDYMTGWGLVLVACVAGSLVAWRQTMLHILPGDEGYGSAVLGLHLYVWALILFQLSVVAVGCAMTVAHRVDGERLPVRGAGLRFGWFALVVAGLVIVVNLVTVFLLEGFHLTLPGDPERWQFFYDVGLLG